MANYSENVYAARWHQVLALLRIGLVFRSAALEGSSNWFGQNAINGNSALIRNSWMPLFSPKITWFLIIFFDVPMATEIWNLLVTASEFCDIFCPCSLLKLETDVCTRHSTVPDTSPYTHTHRCRSLSSHKKVDLLTKLMSLVLGFERIG
jgi:hypothetical protein